MRKILSILLVGCCFVACQRTVSPEKMQLKFRENGTFKIAQFTDLHILEQWANTDKTVATIQFVLEAEHPDLVVFTGDQTIDNPSQEVLPALAFLHIPLTEFSHIIGKKHTTGEIQEPGSPERLNPGLFASMDERGDVMGIFVGHNHQNDAIGLYREVALAYGRTVSRGQ